MIIEHILYNISFAILVGILYNEYFHRNPTWIIVVSAIVPDIDYIFQSIIFYSMELLGIMSPIIIYHGDFHSIVVISILAVIIGYIIHKLCKEDIHDAIFCVFIGGLLHFICDLLVYTYTYYPLFPLSHFGIKTLAILEETRNMPLGLGDWNIMIVGICILTYACIIKFAIDGIESLNYFKFHVRNTYTICLTFLGVIQP
jgi:hypothetical protein